MPGRFGDILWSLPTVRAIAKTIGREAVDLAISAKYGSIAPLIRQQPYIGHVHVLADWQVQETAPMTPWQAPVDPSAYDRVIHLGYQRWPMNALPLEHYFNAVSQWGRELAPIDLKTPWIDAPLGPLHVPARCVVGFTDEWFELKYGIWELLRQDPIADQAGAGWLSISGIPGSRWRTEGGHVSDLGWIGAAEAIGGAHVFLGCCSALHVLACAMGTPAIIVEPSEARWHPIFWPFGMDGPRVTCVKGNDGKPTFDARHVRDAIKQAIHRGNYAPR
jgi:hypothetical protein